MLEDPGRLRIEKLTNATVEEVAALEQEIFSEPWSAEAIAAEVDNPLSVFLVALLDGKVVGYVGMHHVVDEGYIANLAVKEGMRRQGIATQLLQSLDEYAEKNRLEFVTLEVRQSNEEAIALYEKNGYRVEGRRKDFYRRPREDGLIMTKSY